MGERHALSNFLIQAVEKTSPKVNHFDENSKCNARFQDIFETYFEEKKDSFAKVNFPFTFHLLQCLLVMSTKAALS